eukprot:32838_1
MFSSVSRGAIVRRLARYPLAPASLAPIIFNRSLFIQTAQTPNPHSLKFKPVGKSFLDSGTENFVNFQSTKRSPLARKLFLIRGVKVVFLSSDYVAISIEEGMKWAEMKPSIFAAIMDFFDSGEPVMMEATEEETDETEVNEDDDEVVAMIKELINSRIRPAVQDDGGDIRYHSFEEGIVKIEMQGSCVGCPSSSVTLKHGIENMLMHYIPEVKSVEEIASELQALNESEFEKTKQKISSKSDTAKE